VVKGEHGFVEKGQPGSVICGAKSYALPFGKSIKTGLQMPTIGVVRRTMQQTHSTSDSTTATRTTTIRQILIVCVPFGILQQKQKCPRCKNFGHFIKIIEKELCS